MTIDGLPIDRSSRGERVRDLQRRLTALGHAVSGDDPGVMGDATEAAVRSFQSSRGLVPDGRCGTQTWSALVEAGYHLGDRLLYHRSPMIRGDDVTELQHQLVSLGFDTGRVDGIFGPESEQALRDFQRNAGTTTDGVCGRDTLASLRRLGDRTAGSPHLARIRQEEALRDAPRSLTGRRIGIAVPGGLDGLVAALSRQLGALGAVTFAFGHRDSADRARAANEFGADVVLALDVSAEPACRTAYFATPSFESVGGRRLAELLTELLPTVLAQRPSPPEGMRLPVLRETRMPAVACTLGPTEQIVARSEELATALRTALTRWVEQPLA